MGETAGSLRWHWGSAYEFRRRALRHVAVRRDGLGMVTADSLDGLLIAVRDDYARAAVPRRLRRSPPLAGAADAIMGDPFAVDIDNALDALTAEWEAAGYDQIGYIGERAGMRIARTRPTLTRSKLIRLMSCP
jgi:hypothetical protein